MEIKKIIDRNKEHTKKEVSELNGVLKVFN